MEHGLAVSNEIPKSLVVSALREMKLTSFLDLVEFLMFA